MPLMTIRITRKQSARVSRLAKAKRVSRSEVVRQAIDTLDRQASRTALEAWRDAVGIITDGPRDLSTNPRHLKGFGR
jgi:predicted transcriptional regulator